MSVHHNFRLVTGQKAQFDGKFQNLLWLIIGSTVKNLKVIFDKFLLVFTSSTKIQQSKLKIEVILQIAIYYNFLDGYFFLIRSYLFCFLVIKEVGPVWICLHVLELKQFCEQEYQEVLHDVISSLLIKIHALIYR